MNTRDRHVAGQPPKWSKHAQGFRHLDGSSADWRTAQPGHGEPKRDEPRRDGEPRNWSEAYAFLCGALVTLLGCLILLEIFGVRP